MLETLLKYASVYLISMFKFVLGPVAGVAGDLSFLESAIFTILGMMTTVFIILVLGEITRNWLAAKFGFSAKENRFTVWLKKFGVRGIAFFTPILFTPIGGAILAVSIEASKRKIMRTMLVSAIFWGFTISFLFDRLGTAFFGL